MEEAKVYELSVLVEHVYLHHSNLFLERNLWSLNHMYVIPGEMKLEYSVAFT